MDFPVVRFQQYTGYILDALAGKTEHPLSREDLVRCAAHIFAVLAAYLPWGL